MNKTRKLTIRPLALALCAAAIATLLGVNASAQTTATWNGGGGDGLWNNAANWDIGVPAEGTNAFMGAFAVTYDQPMIATSIGSIVDIGGVLNINTNGFVIGNAGNQAVTISGNNSSKLFIRSNGVLSAASGGLTITTNAIGSVDATGTLTLGGQLIVGFGGSSGSGGGAGSFTNRGNITASSLRVNNNTSNPQTCVFINQPGATANVGQVNIGRSAGGANAPGALGTEGLVVNGGIVNMTRLNIGANAHGTFYLADGLVTNAGPALVTNITASRAARFIQTGGLFVQTGITTNSATGAGVPTTYTVTGGTNVVGGIQFGFDTASTGTANFTNSAKIYIGSSGIASNGAMTINAVLNNGGLFGATADWMGSAPMTLAGGSFTFLAAGLDGAAHNINISGRIAGTGSLLKVGPGTLTLSGSNTYSGGTFINEAALALSGTAALVSSPVVVGTNTIFDVSGVTGGFVQPAVRTLGGFGGVTGNVSVASAGIIDPGTNGATGTLSFSNSITFTGGGKAHFDLSSNPTGPNNDLIVINGDLNASGVSNIVDISGGGVAGSVHPLFKYYGSFNGSLANFVIVGATGVLTNDTSTTPAMIALRIATAVRGPTNIVWNGNALVNDWDVLNRTNWLNNGALDFFVNNDNVTFGSAGAAFPNINLPVTVQPNSVTVNASADYTFAGPGSIATGSLTKTNSGRLVVNNTNSFTGSVTINGGTLSVAVLTDDGVAGPLGQTTSVVADGGTLEYSGGTASANRSLTLGSAGGGLSVTDASATLTVGGLVGGTGGLTKSGAGTLSLTGGVNSYPGGTVVSNGTLAINALSAAGSGPVSLASGTTLSIGSAFKPANSIVILGPSIITGGNAGGSCGVSAVSGSADVVVSIKTGVFDIIGSMASYSGTMTLSNAGGASLRFQGTTGSSLATFDLGAGPMDLMIRNSLVNVNIGALKGGAGTTLSGRGGASNNGPTTHHIGASGASTTFDGVIQNGSGGGSSTTSIVKTGAGTLTLTGASTYTGTTTVSNGVLQLDGTFATSAVTVEGGTLGGSGTISGASVTVNTGGTIAPGASPGTLTVGGSVTLNSGSTTSMEIDAGAATNDLLTVAGTITYGGTLNVTNLSGALAAGQVYKLFSAADEFSYLGAFDGGTNLPPLGFGLAWDTTGLATNGTISIYSAVTVNTSRTNITFVKAGGNLTIAWPSDHTGWTLQTQTNSRSVGLNTNWFDVAGSSTTNQVSVPISSTTPTVFYRLFYFIP